MALYTLTGADGSLWSNTGAWTPTPPAGGPGNGDTVALTHSVVIDAAAGVGQNGAVTVGNSLLNAPTGTTTYGTGGASVTSLAAGAYRGKWCIIDTNGKRSPAGAEFTFTVVLNDHSRLTFPALPSGAATLELYLTAAAGATNTETRYCVSVTGTTLDLTSGGWENTDTAGVASGGATAQGSATALPAANVTNAITLTDGKAITGNAGCSLTVRGAAGYSNNGTGCVIAFNGPFALTFDSTQNAAPSVNGYTWTLPIGAAGTFNFTGSAGSRVTVTSNNTGGAANGNFAASGSQAGQSTGSFFDLSNLGSSSVDAWGTANLNGSGNTLSWSDYTVTNCGQCPNATVAHGAAVYSLVRGVYSGNIVNESTSWQIFYNPTAALTTGTRLIQDSRFNQQVKFNALQGLSVNSRGNAGDTGCVFGNGIVCSGTSDFAQFDSALVRWQSPSQGAMNFGAQFTNCVLWLDASGQLNNHGLSLLSGLTATGNTLNWSKNVIYNNTATDNSGNLLLLNNNPAVATTCNVSFNLFLPNGGGTSGGSALTSDNNQTNPAIHFDHNTAFLAGTWALEIGHLYTAVESPNRYVSVHGNLFVGNTGTSSGTSGFIAYDVDNSTHVDVLPATAVAANGRSKITLANSGHAFPNQGNGYAEDVTTTPGASDVDVGTVSFINGAATFSTFDASQGGAGTEAHLLTALLAGTSGYTVSNMLAYFRKAYRPTTVACKGVTTTQDATDSYTTDAAGNGLLGTTGALAYISAAGGLALLGVGG